MIISGKKKNNEKATVNCCEKSTGTKDISIKILGSGCAKCNQLEAATKAALEQMNIDVLIEHVTDFARIAAYGIMTTPALVINEKVVSYGKVLRTDEIVKILKESWV